MIPSETDFASRRPYAFVILLGLLIVAVNMTTGAISGLLPYPILAILAILLVTRKHWWRQIGFTSKGVKSRSFLLFIPVFLPILWWTTIAPMIGYGTLQIPELGTLVLILGFTLLIGFVEEVYFRGMMLQPLKSKGVWTATIVTAFLFGGFHSLNALYGASPLYTLLQVGYAIPLGLSFAALVLVTGLLWPIVLAHGLVNFGAYLNSAAGGPITTTVTQTDYILTAIIIVVYTSYAIILLQRKKASLSSHPTSSEQSI